MRDCINTTNKIALWQYSEGGIGKFNDIFLILLRNIYEGVLGGFSGEGSSSGKGTGDR